MPDGPTSDMFLDASVDSAAAGGKYPDWLVQLEAFFATNRAGRLQRHHADEKEHGRTLIAAQPATIKKEGLDCPMILKSG